MIEGGRNAFERRGVLEFCVDGEEEVEALEISFVFGVEGLRAEVGLELGEDFGGGVGGDVVESGRDV